MRLCETLGVEIPTKRIERDGKTLNVQVLPILTEKDLTGLPVTAVVDRGRDYMKDGVTQIKYEGKFVKAWEGGTRLTNNDLPF